ncbi:MAG: PAS domain S-box protein [Gammaproteobacteria bacterium]
MAGSKTPNSESTERTRLSILKAYQVLDTEPELEFDNLTRMAAQQCNTPVALISLIDESRQWCKSQFGFEIKDTPHHTTFCRETIKSFSLLEVQDAKSDGRFRDNPLVTDSPNIRFYAGVPLTTPEGLNVGTLCVFDQQPRKLTELQIAALEALAHNVVVQFELRRALMESEEARKTLAAEIKKREKLQEAQQRSEQFMQSSLDAIPDHISIVDGSGEIVYVNRAWHEFALFNSADGGATSLGLGANYLAVCDYSSTQGDEDGAVIGATIRAALKDPGFAGEKFEYACHSPTQQRWFIASVAALIVNDQPFAIISHHNVTARKLAEMEIKDSIKSLDARVNLRTDELNSAYSALRASEEKHRALFENSTVGCTVANLEGVFVDVNPVVCSFLGYSRQDLIGKSIASVMHSDDLREVSALRADVLIGRSSGFVCDVRMRRSDGLYVWARASVAAIRDKSGKPIQTMVLIQDVSKQRAAEKERDQVFEKSVDMIVIIKRDGQVVESNPAASRVFGYPNSELQHMNIAKFVHPEDLAKTQRALTAMSLNDDDEILPVLEIRMRVNNGKYRDIRWSGALHEKEDDLIVIGRDVTKSRNTERGLRRLAARLQDIREEERTRISREIHDELGQILTALKIDLDLLRRDIDATGNEQLFGDVDSIISLVNSTLTSVKRIAQDLRPEILDALGLVPALEWHAKEVASRTGLDCEIELLHKIPPLDEVQTTQIFRIIQEALTNVVRHADATFARVTLDVEEDGALKIEIKDDGQGFSIVEVESQSLGILGMHERASNIGATLSFSSNDKKGTLVTLLLPSSRLSV